LLYAGAGSSYALRSGLTAPARTEEKKDLSDSILVAATRRGRLSSLRFGPDVYVNRRVRSVRNGETRNRNILRFQGLHERARGLTPFR